MKPIINSTFVDRKETIKYFDDLQINTSFEVLGDTYLEQLRATLNYSPLYETSQKSEPQTNTPVFDNVLNSIAINNTISEIDYLVLKYFWEDTAGSDLDTRSYIAKPNRKQNMVGWQRQTNDENYLQWSGDNTNSGYEQVLCNIDACRNLLTNNQDKEITIHLRAFWYSTKLSGKVSVQCTGYLGGTMTQNGFEWINTGGRKTQEFIIDTQVNSQEKDDGELLAYIQYNTQTKSGRMIHVQQPQENNNA